MSSSPKRHTFQRDAYLNRCEVDGKQPSEAYLDMFEQILEDNRKRALEVNLDSLEYHLRTTQWILDKARASEIYAQNLYAALCNNEFRRIEIISLLKGTNWSCSWRYAGGIIADMREQGDYIDWYCSGIRNGGDRDTGEVPESVVTPEIRADLEKLGWLVAE